MIISPLWLQFSIFTFLIGFTILGVLAVSIARNHPPVPKQVTGASGKTLFTGDQTLQGQHLFQKMGLMQYGTILGHGAYLGPDFTAQYLHAAGNHMIAFYRQEGLNEAEARARTVFELKKNSYDPASGILRYSPGQEYAFAQMQAFYADWLRGLPSTQSLKLPPVSDSSAVNVLSAFFSWAAWTTAVLRPGTDYSYTNNWPPEPIAGNFPTAQAFIWSVFSLIALIGGAGLVFFFFGKYDLLGWRRNDERMPSVYFVNPDQVRLAPVQRAVVWYFLVVVLLFLAQGLLGGLNAHYHVDRSSFYGFDISAWLPYNLSRTWHVQLAIFFVATSFLAMGIFITPLLSPTQPRHQDTLTIALFVALALLVFGSLIGEAASILGVMDAKSPWFWFGDQGWEYLDLGRFWQILLTVGMLLWVIILARGTGPRLRQEHKGNLPYLLLYSSFSIPAFYAAGMVFGKNTHFAVMDFWRFWVVHLWVEDFLELFTTIMVAYIFVLLGIVHEKTATRVVYLDIILYSIGGVVGTMHHLYFSGAPAVHMALGAFFSAMEVIPLLLLTVEGWRFMRLGSWKTGSSSPPFPHYWALMFLIAVGFWNFLGAGVFGFLINLPIVSYYEIGTGFTANHAHGAMMGVYGMLAIGFFMFVARYFIKPDHTSERAMKISFWSLNIGLGWMLFVNLFPMGAYQLYDSFAYGYWHARREQFYAYPLVKFIEWMRLPGDALFIIGGILPIVYLALRMIRERNRPGPEDAGKMVAFTRREEG
jgi:nitric oxide reductase subunit B